ncbi:MAG: EcsC family protein [Actinomycetes bacterium]
MNDEPRAGAEGKAEALVRLVLDTGLDGVGPLPGAVAVAEQALARAASPEDAIRAVVRSTTKAAGANGFVTGLGGFVTLPVALPANVAGFTVLAARMVGAIAHLRGYDLHRSEVRTAVLVTLAGADATELLRKVGVALPGGAAVGMVVSRLPQSTLVAVNKAVGFRLLVQVGERSLTRLGRAVPLAGGVLGAGPDIALLRRVAAEAERAFPPRHRDPQPGRRELGPG